MTITSVRSVFVGARRTLEFRHDKLVDLEQFRDGLRLNVSNRQTASLLKMPRTTIAVHCSGSHLLAGVTLVNEAAQRSIKAAATAKAATCLADPEGNEFDVLTPL